MRVSLGTVTRAYAEARRRGLVIGQRRRGTIVAPERGADSPLASIVSEPSGAIDLAANWPIYAADPDPTAALREIASRPDVRSLLRYPPPEGGARHRAAGAAWLRSQGVKIDPEALLVSGGAQHGIFLSLAASTIPGDTLLVESLTYPGVLAAARTLGLKVRGVAIDEQGLVPEALEAAFAGSDAKVLYCVPTVHNPTTAILSEARKRQIADIVEQHRGWIIEDEIHRSLVEAPTPTLYELAPERTMLVTAASKALAGSLRVGFVTAPSALGQALLSAVQSSVFAVCPLGAELFATWLENGTVTKTVIKKRRSAERRQRLAFDALAEVDGVRLRGDPAAYFVWLTLPTGRSATRLAADARDRGVRVLPRSAFSAEPDGPDDGVRLCIGSPEDEKALTKGLNTVVDLLRRPQTELAIF